MFLNKPLKPSPTNDAMCHAFCCECLEQSPHKVIVVSRTILFEKENLELNVSLEALQCIYCSAFRFSKEVNERNFECVYEQLQKERQKQSLDSFDVKSSESQRSS